MSAAFINPKTGKINPMRRTTAAWIATAVAVAAAGALLLGCADRPSPPVRPDGLVHHYPFDGHGRIVFDTVGWADGMVVGRARLNGKGAVRLDDGDDFVDLPNGIISAHDDLTIELVVRWRGPKGRYARLFSFGGNTKGEVTEPGGQGGEGTTFLELNLQVEDRNQQQLGFSFALGDQYTFNCASARMLLPGKVHHVVVTVDDLNDHISYYLDGELACRIENVVQRLSSLDDVNNWLGRSQWTNDRIPDVLFYDVKIYNRAMDDQEVRRVYDSGAWRPLQQPR